VFQKIQGTIWLPMSATISYPHKIKYITFRDYFKEILSLHKKLESHSMLFVAVVVAVQMGHLKIGFLAKWTNL
jgi:hypothetical protein